MVTFRWLIFLVRLDCAEIFQDALLLSFYLEKKSVTESTSFLDFIVKKRRIHLLCIHSLTTELYWEDENETI